MSEYLTAAEVAEWLGVSRRSITEWTRNGQMPGAVRMGHCWRYSRHAIAGKLSDGELLVERLTV